ncbi:MAG: DUF6788 family protein, partial [Acidimicrobiales bacterium]
MGAGMETSLPDMEQLRARLYSALAQIGDFRRGSITTNYRRCGKANCACADPAHPGHGPRYLWTRSVPGGKTKGRQLTSGPEVDKVRREMANYKEFMAQVGEIVEINEEICEARPIPPSADAGASGDGEAGPQKRGLFDELEAEFSSEVERLASLAAATLSCPGGDSLATLELAIRTAMQHLGGSLLEELLALDTGHRGPRVEDEAGHRAAFVGYRDKRLDTVLGPVALRRAYYHCSECGGGTVPRDAELGVTGVSISPGLRAMVARVAAAGPFAKAKELFERTVANMVDGDDGVECWVRLHVGELPILWNSGGQRYNPDFIVIENDGTHWVVEVKMDKEMTS